MLNQSLGIARYGRIASTETDPLRQIVLLYDGAIKFLNLTAADIEGGDMEQKAEHSRRALEIISYLQSILDFDRGGEVASSLDRLYRSVTVLVLKGSAALDAAQMRKAADVLVPVRDAWRVNASAAVPGYEMAGA